MLTDSITVMKLTQIVYNSANFSDSTISLTHKNDVTNIICLDYINETNSFVNGLQAAAYLNKETRKIYVIIRGADVGIGKSIFKIFGANQRFIPESIEEHPWKTVFQDWIYTASLGSMGLVHLYQYDSLNDFCLKLVKKFPGYEFIVGGHSLGGMLAQRLYILNNNFTKCITFSAVSPWWTFNTRSQRILQRANFLESDKIVNYYSYHDPFRWAPPFSRNLGEQINVLLQPFQSRSNIMASFLERIYWAHVPNYFTFDKKGNINVNTRHSKLENLYQYLNQRSITTWWINLLIILVGIIPSAILISLIALFLGISPNSNHLNLLFLTTFSGTLASLVGTLGIVLINLFFSVIYMLPTLLTKTRWKYIILAINLCLSWTGIAWFLLLVLAVVLNYIADAK